MPVRIRAKNCILTKVPAFFVGEKPEDRSRALKRCYQEVLAYAKNCRVKSLAIPLLRTAFDIAAKSQALQIAVEEISRFLEENELEICLVLTERDNISLFSEKQVQDVHNYIRRAHELRIGSIRRGMDDRVFSGGSNEGNDKLYAQNDYRRSNYKQDIEVKFDDRVFSSGDSYDEEEIDGAGIYVDKPYNNRNVETKKFNLMYLRRKIAGKEPGFSETLLKLIDQSGKKDSDIYKKANVDRKLFSKIRNNPAYKPTKATALAFAIALELNLNETNDLIGRASYTLSRSSQFDIIIEYFIIHERYDIYEINMMLFEFDQSLIGA